MNKDIFSNSDSSQKPLLFEPESPSVITKNLSKSLLHDTAHVTLPEQEHSVPDIHALDEPYVLHRSFDSLPDNTTSLSDVESPTFPTEVSDSRSLLFTDDPIKSSPIKDIHGLRDTISPLQTSPSSKKSHAKKTSDAESPFSTADMISPSRADIYADSIIDASDSKSRLKKAVYHAAVQHGATTDYTDRVVGAARRTTIAGTAMTYSAIKKTSHAVHRQSKFAIQSHRDLKDGITDKRTILLKNGRFAVKQGKTLLIDAQKRLAHEGLLIIEDSEGSDDLGMQALIKTKDAVRDTSRAVSTAHRLFGKNKEKKSLWQTLRRVPSVVSTAASSTGQVFSKIVTGIAKIPNSFSMIAIIAMILVVSTLVVPAAYAITGTASLASDDATLTEVYTYITELDAKLSKKINEYNGKADVVSYSYNGANMIDPITITTNPDPILNYLDCVYGDYKFSDVKSAIDDIYSAVYKIDVSEYVQDVSGTSEADKKNTTDTVVDTDETQGGTSTDEKKDTDFILTYTPTYGGIVSKKPGSTLTTAILNNAKCLGQFKLTFYCGCRICSEGWGTQTATGVTATEGRTIAVDPRVIPYGTKVHIDGFGDFIAEDCGGAIKGNRIDVFVSDHQRCNSLGVQYAAVYAMNSNITGGIYIPGISKNQVKHMDVNVTSQTLTTYLQGLMKQEQKDKSDFMNQLGQYTTHMNYDSPLESNAWSVAQRYGYQYGSGAISQHFGIDISVSTGQKLLAVTAGTIAEIGSDNEHGSYLILERGKSRFLYGNLGRLTVKKGDKVQRGDTIAHAGHVSDNCAVNSVHMEYTHDGKLLNPSFYLYNELSGSNVSGIGSTDIVEVARSQLGQRGGQPYWSFMGFHSRVAWCASFVSWCANQCGYIDAGIIPKFAACQAQGIPWFQQHGLWQDRSYTPVPGDIIFFDWEGDGHSDHVGIVERVENGMVYTIEGNSSDAVNERKYTIGSSQICGYGVPQYPKGN